MSLRWQLNEHLGYDAFDEDNHIVGMLEHLSDNSWGASIICPSDGFVYTFERLFTRGYLSDEAKTIVELEWERRKTTPLYKDIFPKIQLL